MRLPLISAFAALLSTALAAGPSTVAVSAWPLSSPSPIPIASITLTSSSSSSEPIAKLDSFDGLKSNNPRDLIRIGFHDSEGKWRGTVAPAAWFDKHVDRTIILHVSQKGEIYHIGVGSEEVPDPKVVVKKEREAMTKKQKKKLPKVKVSELVRRDGVTTIEVVEIDRAPMPALNRPVVLNPEGKVESKEEEKTFFQKYWWMIGAFLLFNVLIGGGGGGEGGEGGK